MILNHTGRLIGVVHSVFVRFHHISLGVTYDDTKNFIQENIKKYELYMEVMKELGLKDIFTPN